MGLSEGRTAEFSFDVPNGGHKIEVFGTDDHTGPLAEINSFWEGSPFAILYDFQSSRLDQGGNLFISGNDDAVAVGYQGSDIFFGFGRLEGNGGDDAFRIFDSVLKIPPDLAPGAASSDVARAYGGVGSDSFYVSIAESRLYGGADDDTFVLLSGKSTINGGSDSDTYVMLNFLEDSGDYAAKKTIVRDFAADEDVLVFSFEDPSYYNEEDELVEQTFADLYGAGTLADLNDVTIDGITLNFFENNRGHTVFTREGVATDGVVYDERLVLRNVSLDDLDREDITIFNEITEFDV